MNLLCIKNKVAPWNIQTIKEGLNPKHSHVFLIPFIPKNAISDAKIKDWKISIT